MADTDEKLDTAETVVWRRLLRLGCVAPVDPYDSDDCGSVAVEAVKALREAGLLPSAGEPWSVEHAVVFGPDDDVALADAERTTAIEWAQRWNAHDGGDFRAVQRFVGPWRAVDQTGLFSPWEVTRG